MTTFLILGTLTGSVLGLIHARGVYRQRVQLGIAGKARPDSATRLRAGYSAAWTALLWTAFGSYVLILWLVSTPLWLAYRATSRPLRGLGA